MGTQQILLIVLSVIIVGAAVAVGIQMFNSQDFSSNRAAASADVQLYLTQVLQYYKMPRSLGGLGNSLSRNNTVPADIAAYIGWGSELPMVTDNAYYTIQIPGDTGSVDVVDIKAIGASVKNGSIRSIVHSRIFLPEGRIDTKVGEQSFSGAIGTTNFGFDLLSDGTAGSGKQGVLGW